MGLFNFFKKDSYDLDSIEGINKIGIPKYPPLKGLESPVNNIEYILQRKATEHKKNGRMDLAIACLKKSNELMPYSNFKYSEKDYVRYIKYLRYDGQNELADTEEKRLYAEHPEFNDRRISNLLRIREALEKNKGWGNDLVIVNTSHSCDICGQYDRKIYSISGNSKQYPKLPKEISQNGGFCPKCYLGLNSYFEGISTPPKPKNESVRITVNGHDVDIHALYVKYPRDKVSAVKELCHITKCSLTEGKKQRDDYYSTMKSK